ncbi:MAG TPA: hypothetical protein VJU60_14090 [Thermoleophilaceae bacterium]|nr:hypothetical protein [Thermoleophilaceae bacterium]
MNLLAEVTEAADPALREYAVQDPGPGRFNGSNGLGRERALVLEAVYEGYLLHYETPRAFRGMDADLRLLAGDSLYALGLERLAVSGDIEAVRELSDLISLCAFVQAEGRPELAEELWQATTRALSGDGGQGAREALSRAL